jgi:hypothetical protein
MIIRSNYAKLAIEESTQMVCEAWMHNLERRNEPGKKSMDIFDRYYLIVYPHNSANWYSITRDTKCYSYEFLLRESTGDPTWVPSPDMEAVRLFKRKRQIWIDLK